MTVAALEEWAHLQCYVHGDVFPPAADPSCKIPHLTSGWAFGPTSESVWRASLNDALIPFSLLSGLPLHPFPCSLAFPPFLQGCFVIINTFSMWTLINGKLEWNWYMHMTCTLILNVFIVISVITMNASGISGWLTSFTIGYSLFFVKFNFKISTSKCLWVI